VDDHTIHLSWSWILLPLVLLLIVIGAFSSPRDTHGKPLLLLPDMKAVEDYCRSMSSAIAGMQLLDGEIAALLAGQNTDLFTQSRQAQAAFEHALRIAQEVDVQTAPPVLDSLRGSAASTASAYLDTARLALIWVSLPEEDNLTIAENSLSQAHQQLEMLEESKWLATR
jgi:hypothetical protein